MSESREVAERIVQKLFTNGSGERGAQLRLYSDFPGAAVDARYLGGWSERAVRDVIEQELQRAGVDPIKEISS